jgi:hypothetical protein
MARDETIGRPPQSRRLLDASLPAAAVATIGFSALALSLLLTSMARDFAATPFSASYAPDRNPWMAARADTWDRPSVNPAPAAAVAFQPEHKAPHPNP